MNYGKHNMLRRSLIATLACVALFTYIAPATPLGVTASEPEGATGSAAFSASVRTEAERELFGMVVRDPFYEYNTDPERFPNAPNRVALERQASELASAGVRWIRMEFFADYDGSVEAGSINWSKYDWFIRELAPRYGLKVLGLLNVGMVAHNGQTLRTLAFNDPPDGGGSDTLDGSNHFIRVFTGRAQAIAHRYGTDIAAYEIINEPNISYDLWLDSGHGSAEIKPERYSALIGSAYRAIKNVAPHAQVIIGGMLIGSPPEGQDHDQFDYLYQVYMSPWVQRYVVGGYSSRPGWNVVPWDGVALHPYALESTELFAILKDFNRKLQDRGDYNSKLWITEVGAQSRPPNDPASSPTRDEEEQASYLRSVYNGVLSDTELRAGVAHIFWFKYEDFVPGRYTHNYGLVRLAESDSGKAYHPSGRVWVHKLAYKAYQEIALGYTLTEPVEVDEAGTGSVYFPETSQAIAPQFAEYWHNNGGVGRFGYPISRPVPIRGYLSQFFERAVFEWHPENAGTPFEVQLGLLGANLLEQGLWWR